MFSVNYVANLGLFLVLNKIIINILLYSSPTIFQL